VDAFRRWAASSQGAWVIVALLLLLAAINLASGTWWLSALLLVVAAVNVRRALQRRQAG
jgi:hypothetical protein